MANRFSRRSFIKLSAVLTSAIVTIAAAGAKAVDGARLSFVDLTKGLPKFRANQPTQGESVEMKNTSMQHANAAPALVSSKNRWVMVIDLAKCDGCKECTAACNAMHFVPPNQEWIKVIQNRHNEVEGSYWFPRPCMQCDNSPCVKVCPVGATYKREDGIVLIDHDRCLGCRYCVAACPYGSRSFNWEEPPHTPEELSHKYSVEWNFPHRRHVVEKCIFCPVNSREGKLPACASACTMNAIYFGDQAQDVVTSYSGEVISFTQLIREKGGFRYMEDLGTEPRVWYLPPRDRVFPAPKG